MKFSCCFFAFGKWILFCTPVKKQIKEAHRYRNQKNNNNKKNNEKHINFKLDRMEKIEQIKWFEFFVVGFAVGCE